MNHFTSITLEYNTIDIFYIRSSILKALIENKDRFFGDFLDIGCGQMPYKSLLKPHVSNYIGLDLENSYSVVKPDLYWDGIKIPLEDSTIDCAMATEVLEHVPDSRQFLSEVRRILKPGGLFFFTVPFLWPLHDVPHDEFRYTPFSLRRIFETNGFDVVKMHSLGGWNASMAQMLGLWIKRGNLPSLTRKILYVLVLPFYKILINTDRTTSYFSESSMITGITGLIIKK